MAWWHNMVSLNLTIIGSGNAPLTDKFKPWPKPMLTYHEVQCHPSVENFAEYVEVISNSNAWKFHIWNLTTSTVFKITTGPRTLTGKIWVGPASSTSLSYINFGKIVFQSGKFKILFWRLPPSGLNRLNNSSYIHLNLWINERKRKNYSFWIITS